MYLKRIDIKGFKSFPDGISLTIDKGLTAIVGPNGSGKSNIADAVRWTLGEQSIRSLRGNKTEDVIFSGTQTRKPLGFAEVSIVLNNEKSILPISFTEVIVTRRVYRSGESEYFLNGKKVRLKDLDELFMDTGLGKEGYAIIGQGQIESVLNVKSEQRRLLLEEAAGIMKFKTRLIETGKKLELEHQNLLRLKDISLEIESSLAPLKEEAEKAKEYLSFAEELKKLEVAFFITEESRLDQLIKKVESDILINSQQLEALNTQKETLFTRESKLKQKLDYINERITSGTKNVYEIRSSIEKKEGSVRLYSEQRDHIRKNIESINADSYLQKEKIQQLNTELDLINAEISSKELTLKALRADEQDLKESIILSNKSIMVTEEASENFKSEIIEKMKDASEIEVEISKAESAIDRDNEKQAQINTEINELKQKINENQDIIKLCNDRIFKLNLYKKDAEEKYKDICKKYLEAQRNLEALKDKQQSTSFKYSNTVARINVLKEMQNEKEGFWGSTKIILSAAKKGELKGIEGAVGENLTVPKEYEIAISTALGASIQNIIVTTENEAKSAIAYLKKVRGGKSTFLPLTSVKVYESIPRRNLIGNGIIGIASEVVKYSEKYKPVFQNLLNRIVVIDNIDNAINFAKSNNYAYRCVTLTGETISPSGSYTGGSQNNNQTNIFSRTREIGELQADIDKLAHEKDSIEQQLDIIQREYNIIFQEKESLTNQLKETDINNAQITKSLDEISESLKEQNSKHEALLNDLNFYKMKENETINKLNFLRENRVKISLEIDQINNEIMEIQDSFKLDRQKRDEILDEINSLTVVINQNKESISVLKEKANSATKSLNEVLLESENKKSILSGLKEELQEKSEEITKTKNEVLTMKELAFKEEEEVRQLEEAKRTIETEKQEVEEEIKKSYADNEILISSKNKSESLKDKYENERRILFDYLWENYEMTRSEAYTYKDDINVLGKEGKKKINQYKDRIRAMGYINTLAIEQYKTQKERFEFLQKQMSDISEAEIKLKEIMGEITQLMKNQFKEKFMQISEFFNQVFQDIFGGGKAELVLNDETKILESGIDIVVSLPGKKNQSISLLSGGEKALTAIALLFAIFKLKPSPFSVLDEIEAALDDANIIRFSNYLQKLKDETQFIIITHRKGTMEAAEALYGITMEEQGVSKLVSVKLA